MKLTTTDAKSSEFALIDENEIINCRLTNVENNDFVYDGEDIHRLRWLFTIMEDGQWKGKTLFGDTSTTFTAHPNCKAYNWAVAISGRNFENGEDFDTDDLIGLPCRIIVGHKAGKDDRVWMRARDVLPPRGGAKGGSAAEPAPF